MAKVKELNQQNKPTPQVFDPTKVYNWDANLNIGITGVEFDAILKALNANTQGNTFQAHIMQYEALKLVQGILKRNVEIGAIKEAPEAPVTDTLAVR